MKKKLTMLLVAAMAAIGAWCSEVWTLDNSAQMPGKFWTITSPDKKWTLTCVPTGREDVWVDSQCSADLVICSEYWYECYDEENGWWCSEECDTEDVYKKDVDSVIKGSGVLTLPVMARDAHGNEYSIELADWAIEGWFKYGGSQITKLIIPSDYTSYFGEGTSLAEFEVEKNNPIYYLFDGAVCMKSAYREDYGSGDVLIQFSAGKKGKFRIPDNVTKVRSGAFEKSTLTELIIGPNLEIFESDSEVEDQLKTISVVDNDRFKYENGLLFGDYGATVLMKLRGVLSSKVDINIPATVTKVGEYAMAYTDGKTIKNIVFTSPTLRLEDGALHNCLVPNACIDLGGVGQLSIHPNALSETSASSVILPENTVFEVECGWNDGYLDLSGSAIKDIYWATAKSCEEAGFYGIDAYGVNVRIHVLKDAGDWSSIERVGLTVIKDMVKTSRITAVSSDEVAGTVTGGGRFDVGQAVTLTAKANKGYAFAGWYDEDGMPAFGNVDYRLAQFSYTVDDNNRLLTAKFVPIIANVNVKATPEKGQVFAGWYTDSEFRSKYVAADGMDYRKDSCTYPYPVCTALFPRFVSSELDDNVGLICNLKPYYDANAPMILPVEIESYSLPTVTAANLPAGLKFDANTMLVSGVPTKPGEGKDVKFTVKNLTNKQGSTFVVSIKIGDARAPSLPDLKYNDANGYAPFVPGAEQNMAAVLGQSTMDVLAQGGWTVTGLPAGMKFDSKTGKFSGAPTKANENCTVTFKKGTEIATITLRTGALPPLKITSYLIDDGNDYLAEIPESRVNEFKVTGAGGYAVGKPATLSATAPKGYVFAGWYTDAECTILAENGTQDYRTASSYKFTMPEDATSKTGVNLYAMFIHASHDFAWVKDFSDWDDEITVSINQGDTMPTAFIKNAVFSGSLPTVTVKGLPAGLKFDAKTLLISGKATDKTPKWYDLIVSVKNAAGYTFTGIFGISVNGGTPAEDIDDLGISWQLDWLDYLYVGDIIMDEACFGTSNDGVTGVTGLPAEMKLYKGTEDGETYFLVAEVNDEMPVIKTPGVYTITVNGKVDGKAAKTTKRFVIRDSESIYERVLVANGCEDMGTVTGNDMVVHPGSAFAINATAKKGYVFAGWYADPDCQSRAYFMPEFADYRQASQKAATVSLDTYSDDLDIAIAPTTLNPTTWYAKFVEKSDDAKISIEDIGHQRYPEYYYYQEEFVFDLEELKEDVEIPLAISSESLPMITFKNLPSWMDKDSHQYFDGLWLWYNEKAEPDPGEYTFTMSVKNASGATAEKKFTIKVPNYENPNLPLDYQNGYTLMPGEVFDSEIMLSPGLDLRGWSITGLPSGMKFDSKTGRFSGAPDKPDATYTVWFKKAGEPTATITMRTRPSPILELELAVAGHNNVWGLTLDESIEVPADSKFTLSGAGSYIANKEVTLGAKAPTGWVFAGWQEVDSQNLGIGMCPGFADMNLDSKTNDTRVAAYKFKMPATERIRLRGVFIHQSQDMLNVGIDALSMPVELYAGTSIGVVDNMKMSYIRNVFTPNQIISSFPTITASGLPAGLKFDAKNLLLSGKVTAVPGYYYATFTAKNLSGYTYTQPIKFLVHKSFEEIDPNMKDPADIDTIPDDWSYGLGLEWLVMMKQYSPFTVGYIPAVGMMPGIYEPHNWGYMIPEDSVYLGYYDKSGYPGEMMEYGIASISGLPKGLALEKEKETWSESDGYKEEYVYYETQNGSVPTTPGWTRFTITAKDYDWETLTSREGKFSKMLPVYDAPSRYVLLKVVGEGGAVAGGGVWNAGKEYTITATPAKNYSFSGWYEDPECTMPAMNWTFGAECDYRVAKQKWTVASLANYSDMGMFNGMHTFYAKFIPNTEVSAPQIDILGYDFEYEPMEPSTWTGSLADGSLVLNIENQWDSMWQSDFGFKIKAGVLPQLSIKGLPKNVGFDSIYADGLTCIEFSEYDALLVPGKYPVTLTVKLNSKTYSYPFTINVGNKKSGMYGEYGVIGQQLDYSKDAYQMDVGCDTQLPFLVQPEGDDYAITVKGLPTGMKWDPKTGIVSGVPTKTGVYTITVLTTCYGYYGDSWTEEDTVTMNVNALPDWAVGTFNGDGDFVNPKDPDGDWMDGVSTLTVSKTGALSGKVIYSINGKQGTATMQATAFSKNVQLDDETVSRLTDIDEYDGESPAMPYQGATAYVYEDVSVSLPEYGTFSVDVYLYQVSYGDDGESIGIIRTIQRHNKIGLEDDVSVQFEGVQNLWERKSETIDLPVFDDNLSNWAHGKKSHKCGDYEFTFGDSGKLTVVYHNPYGAKQTASAQILVDGIDYSGTYLAWTVVSFPQIDEMVWFAIDLTPDERGLVSTYGIDIWED